MVHDDRHTERVAGQWARAMKVVLVEVEPLLLAEDFRRRRRFFNRVTEPGLVQVVDFQLHYDRFTVNLGVYVEDLARHWGHRGKSNWNETEEADCHLRLRLGHLLPSRRDTWWSLTDLDRAISSVRLGLVNHALPWLADLRRRSDIIDAHGRGDFEPLKSRPVSVFDVALLRIGCGQLEAGEEMIRGYLQRDLSEAHRERLNGPLRSVGLREIT
jgi:hypothetical protein